MGARDSVTEPCQQQEDRTKFEESSLDLPTTFTCDHSESGNCDAQLQNFETQVNSMIEGLTNDVNAKQQLYNEAKAACDSAKAGGGEAERAGGRSRSIRCEKDRVCRLSREPP